METVSALLSSQPHSLQAFASGSSRSVPSQGGTAVGGPKAPWGHLAGWGLPQENDSHPSWAPGTFSLAFSLAWDLEVWPSTEGAAGALASDQVG